MRSPSSPFWLLMIEEDRAIYNLSVLLCIFWQILQKDALWMVEKSNIYGGTDHWLPATTTQDVGRRYFENCPVTKFQCHHWNNWQIFFCLSFMYIHTILMSVLQLDKHDFTVTFKKGLKLFFWTELHWNVSLFYFWCWYLKWHNNNKVSK